MTNFNRECEVCGTLQPLANYQRLRQAYTTKSGKPLTMFYYHTVCNDCQSIPAQMDRKVCDTCGTEKLLEEFDTQGAQKLYQNSHCKPCRRETARAHQQRNAPAVVAPEQHNEAKPAQKEALPMENGRGNDGLIVLGAMGKKPANEKPPDAREALLAKAKTYTPKPGDPYYVDREQIRAAANEAADKYNKRNPRFAKKQNS